MKLESSPLPPIHTSPHESKMESVESPSCSTPSSAASSSATQQPVIMGQSTVDHQQMAPLTQEPNAHLIDQEHCPVCGDRVSGYHCKLKRYVYLSFHIF